MTIMIERPSTQHSEPQGCEDLPRIVEELDAPSASTWNHTGLAPPDGR